MAYRGRRDCTMWLIRTLRRQFRANRSIFAIFLVLVSLSTLLLLVRISRKISEMQAEDDKREEFDWDFDEELENTKFDSNNPVKEYTQPPIKHFKFYALHKTGSTITRHELERFCKDQKLKCLGYANCHLHPIEVIRCFRNNTQHTDTGWATDYGTFTIDRMNAGCCPLMQDVQMFHGLIDHFSLHGEANRRFIANAFPKDSFQFTIVREPSEQFISYHKMLYDVRYQFPNIPSLRQTIELCYNHTKQKTQLDGAQLALFQLLTNSQSKELGWTGNKDDGSLKDVLQLVTWKYVLLSDFIDFSN